MRRRSVGLILALLLAAAGTVGLVAYARSADDRAAADEDLVEVFVAVAPITRGTPGSELEGLTEATQVPVAVRASGAIGSLTEIEDLVATVDLVEGEQLVTSRFAPTGVANTAGVGVPEGWMTVTIELERVRALNGAISVGDSVAALASFSPFDEANDEETQVPAATAEQVPDALAPIVGDDAIVTPTATGFIARQIRVVGMTAAASTTGDPDAPPPPTLRLTLAMAPDDVEQIVFASEFGTLWLAHDPETASDSSPGPETRDSVFLYGGGRSDLASVQQ